MAVRTKANCGKIQGMYKGNGTQINEEAYFFPFVPIAFITGNKGTFTPPKINTTKSGKKYAIGLQALNLILEGRTPWIS